MIATLTAPQAVWLLLCMQSPATLLLIGGIFGILSFHFALLIARLLRVFRLAATQRDREAQVMREARAAAAALGVRHE